MDGMDIAGKRHIVVNKNMWFKDMAKILSTEFDPQGYNVSLHEAPYVLMWVMARFDAMTRHILDGLNKECILDNSRMRSVLKIEPHPMKETVLEMAYSLIERGVIKKTKKYRGPAATQ